MSRYRPQSLKEGKLVQLPKTKITLEMPGDSRLKEKLKSQHNNLFASELGSWSEFVRPFSSLENGQSDKLVLDCFALDSVQRSNKSRSQIVETNEAPFLFVYGDQAELYTFSLQLLDGGRLATSDEDINWLNKFEDFYTRFRAQTIVDYQMRLSIHYKNNEFFGVWLNMDIQENSEFDTLAVATFQFYCTKKIRLRSQGE